MANISVADLYKLGFNLEPGQRIIKIGSNIFIPIGVGGKQPQKNDGFYYLSSSNQ